MKRISITIVPLLIITLLLIMLMDRLANPRMSGAIDSPLIGQSVPLHINTKPPYIINMFASWCAPCAIENPYLLQMQKHGIKIIGVAYKDTPEKIKKFLKISGNPYTEILYDVTGSTGITLGITGVPESFAVDSAGIIRARLQGPFTSDDTITNFLDEIK